MNKPTPIVDDLTEPYWRAIADGYLALQRCAQCRHWIHFPEPRCPACSSKQLAYEAVSGKGEIESYSIIHRSFVEGFQSSAYAIAWIALPEQIGLRVMCNIVDCDLANIAIGQTVELCFEQREAFGQIPQFKPVSAITPTPTNEFL